MMSASDQREFPALISENEIHRRVGELAREIHNHYGRELPLFVGILNGSIMFMADLARAIAADVRMEFMAVSSYGNSTTSSGAVRILKDLDSDISGQRILIVEDIVDSGTTLEYLLRMLGERDPADIKIVALLRKPQARAAGTNPDWLGFEIDDHFVVGYGLDFAGRHRNLPYIGLLHSDDGPV